MLHNRSLNKLQKIEDAKKALDDAKAALNELNKPVTDPDSSQTGDNSNIAL